MTGTTGAWTAPPRPPRPWLGALLSFLFPGLGQAYAGQLLLASILAAPIVLLVVLAAIVLIGLGGELRNDILSTRFLTGLIVLDVALLAWRVFAIAHVGLARPARMRLGARRWQRWVGLTVVTVLVLVTVAMHAYVGVVVSRVDQTLADVFTPGNAADAKGAGDGEEPDGAPINRPDYRWDGEERINFLLLGVDSAPGRETALTDTILAVSVDPSDRTAVMISVPRDTAFVPLPDTSVYANGLYPHKINELSSEATRDAALWCPDLPPSAAERCGLRTLQRAVGLYLGIALHYYATVDLVGFAQLIDAVGGLELCLPGRVVDPEYTGPGAPGRDRGIVLEAGCRDYDGDLALAYARSRKGWMELPDGTRELQTDFMRAERQQQVLLGLRRELADMNLIFDLPGIMEAVGQTVDSDFPRGRAGDLASLLPLIAGPDIDRVVLDHPEFVDLSPNPTENYFLIPRRDAVRGEMVRLFGSKTELEGWYLGSTAASPDEPTP